MLEIAQRQLLHIIVFPLCLMPKRQRTLAAEQPGVATIKFRSSENYMSGLCWQVIRSDVAVDNSKLFCMASHMTKLGMTAQSLDETSIAEAVCLALFQSPRTDASLDDATRTLKGWLVFFLRDSRIRYRVWLDQRNTQQILMNSSWHAPSGTSSHTASVPIKPVQSTSFASKLSRKGQLHVPRTARLKDCVRLPGCAHEELAC